MYNKIAELIQKHSDNSNYILELSPARLLLSNVYEHAVPAEFFNEYLSHISKMQWDKIYTGYQYYYYLNDTILLVNPDGKETCYITKLIENEYYEHPDLLEYKKCPVQEVQDKLGNIEPKLESSSDTPLEKNLKCNLRLRYYRQIPVSSQKFPSNLSYNSEYRHVYRIYNNDSVKIKFEIIRPLKCDKPFENLLLQKPDSKFVIKIYIKDNKIRPYLEYFIN